MIISAEFCRSVQKTFTNVHWDRPCRARPLSPLRCQPARPDKECRTDFLISISLSDWLLAAPSCGRPRHNPLFSPLCPESRERQGGPGLAGGRPSTENQYVGLAVRLQSEFSVEPASQPATPQSHGQQPLPATASPTHRESHTFA